MEIKETLIKVLEYIKQKEEIIDGEYGKGREFDQIMADGDCPALYHEVQEAIINLINLK